MSPYWNTGVGEMTSTTEAKQAAHTPGPKLRFRKVSTVEGLALTGQANAKRGSVLVRVGFAKIKRYAFRRRMGDGHVLIRWGRLAGATVSEIDGCDRVSVVFDYEPRAALTKAGAAP